ncbi:MAG: hypothetical protein ABF301_04870 [Sulfurovum sp.]
MSLNENILLDLNCEVYKYNFRNNSFQIRNYYKTNTVKLLQEYDKIVSILTNYNLKFKVSSDNSIQIL